MLTNVCPVKQCIAVKNLFFQGCSKIVEVKSGRPVEIATDASVQLVEETIRGDRQVRIDSLPAALPYSSTETPS
jgi:hypothetical protein